MWYTRELLILRRVRVHARGPTSFWEENIIVVVILLRVLARIASLRNRTGEQRRRQTLCDKRTIILFEKTFRQTSLFFKQIEI